MTSLCLPLPFTWLSPGRELTAPESAGLSKRLVFPSSDGICFLQLPLPSRLVPRALFRASESKSASSSSWKVGSLGLVLPSPQPQAAVLQTAGSTLVRVFTGGLQGPSAPDDHLCFPTFSRTVPGTPIMEWGSFQLLLTCKLSFLAIWVTDLHPMASRCLPGFQLQEDM